MSVGERTRSVVEHRFACGGCGCRGASGWSGRRSGRLGLGLGGESREFGVRGGVGGLEADDAREVGARLVHAAERAARHRTSVVHLDEQRVLLARGGGGDGGGGVGGEHIERERAVRLGSGKATCSSNSRLCNREWLALRTPTSNEQRAGLQLRLRAIRGERRRQRVELHALRVALDRLRHASRLQVRVALCTPNRPTCGTSTAASTFYTQMCRLSC